MGVLWSFDGIAMASLWDFHDVFLIFLWVSCGISMKFSRGPYRHEVSMVFYWIFMRFLLDFYATSKGFLCGSCEVSMMFL